MCARLPRAATIYSIYLSYCSSKQGRTCFEGSPAFSHKDSPVAMSLSQTATCTQECHGREEAMRHKRVAITINSFSLARPKGNPGYLSNSGPLSTAFLFKRTPSICTGGMDIFLFQDQDLTKNPTQAIGKTTLRDTLISIQLVVSTDVNNNNNNTGFNSRAIYPVF